MSLFKFRLKVSSASTKMHSQSTSVHDTRQDHPSASPPHSLTSHIGNVASDVIREEGEEEREEEESGRAKLSSDRHSELGGSAKVSSTSLICDIY